MASLLDGLSGILTPELIGSLGKTLGLDPKMVEQGMAVVGPLLTSGMANASSTPDGLSGLMNLLPKEASSGDVMSMIQSVTGSTQGQDAISQLMNSAFGGGLNTALRSVDKAVGFPVSGLLVAAAPMALNLIKKYMTTDNMDAAGVAKMLQDDSKAFMEKGGVQADIVKGAWDSVDNLNKLKSRFSEQELAAIGGAPIAVTGLVMAASPSKGTGAMQELAAAAAVINSAQDRAGGVSILDLLPKMDDAAVKAYLGDQPKSALLGTVKNAVGVVASKAPDAAANYRSFLVTLANEVANASKEGGFLGFGGKQVSDAEAAIVAEITSTVEG